MSNIKQHAKLSASGSSQWLNCPGSIKAQENYKNESSIYAIEGTCAHELADMCLREEKDAEHFLNIRINAEGNEFVPDEEMCEAVQKYLDYVRAFENEYTTLYTEEVVDFSHVVPGGFGTTDSLIIDTLNKTAHVFDYKHGKGVLVSAKDNTQGKMYCLGILNDFGMLEEIEQFVFHIIQPRTIPANFSHFKINVGDILEFAEYVKERAILALSEDPPRVPGDKQCQWCRAKEDCAQRAKIIEKVFKEAFDDFDNLEEDIKDCSSENLTKEQRKILLDNQEHIESILNDNRKAAQNILEKGEQFEGYKLVLGRSNRKWNEKAEKYLTRKLGKKNAFEEKLIGIGKAEKLLTEKEISKITEKPEAKPIMVSELDKRKAIDVRPIAEQFDNLEDL